MAGFFFVGALIVWLVKRALMWLFLRRYLRKRYALRRVDAVPRKDGTTRFRRCWREVPTHTYGSLMHVGIELLSVAGYLIAVYFSGSVGNVNVWQHSTSLSIILGIVSIVFMPALQQFGAGAIVLLTCKVAHGEYYEVNGTNIEGRVSSMSMWDVEFEVADKPTGAAVFHLVPMATILAATLTRNLTKEREAPRVTRWRVHTAARAHAVHNADGEDEDVYGGPTGDSDTESSERDYDHDSEWDDGHAKYE